MQLSNTDTQLKPTFVGEGIVDRVVDPNRRCRIKFGGSYWSAKTASPFALYPGATVRVVGRQNSILLVEPASSSQKASV